jgi:hypothetical protein
VQKGDLRALRPFKPLSEETLIKTKSFSEEDEEFWIRNDKRSVKRTTGIKGSFRVVAQGKRITGDGIATITR